MTNNKITELVHPVITAEQYEQWLATFDKTQPIPQHIHDYMLNQLSIMLNKFSQSIDDLDSIS